MTKRRLEPILEGGVRFPHFFNGRVLTAEDLRAQQAATQEQRQQLALAIGEGVVRGLEVKEPSGSTVTITPGLAYARNGQAVALGSSITLELVPPPRSGSEEGGSFHDCATPLADSAAITTGAYLLTASVAAVYEGKAPMASLQGSGQIAGCGTRYQVEGIQFRLIELTPPAAPSPTTLRNHVANWLLGTAGFADAMARPFTPETSEGQSGLEALRKAGRLTAGEVPLALIYWASSKVSFVDLWAARRPVAASVVADLPGRPWAAFLDPARQAVALAQFHQFQEQVDSIHRQNALRPSKAETHFTYLPPVGILPLRYEEATSFLGSFTRSREYTLDPAFLPALLQRVYTVAPIFLGPGTLPTLGLYHIPGESVTVFARRLGS